VLQISALSILLKVIESLVDFIIVGKKEKGSFHIIIICAIKILINVITRSRLTTIWKAVKLLRALFQNDFARIYIMRSRNYK